MKEIASVLGGKVVLANSDTEIWTHTLSKLANTNSMIAININEFTRLLYAIPYDDLFEPVPVRRDILMTGLYAKYGCMRIYVAKEVEPGHYFDDEETRAFLRKKQEFYSKPNPPKLPDYTRLAKLIQQELDRK
jgi:hypothetical protein